MIYNQGFGGGMKPKIIVTAPTGTVVTATKGTTVITAGESGGKYVILADDYGVWTIAGTKGSQSVSQDVNVVAVDTYELTLDMTPKVLNDATWEQIRDVADASTGPNYWSVGDTKEITINGKLSDGLTLNNYSTWVYIIGFDHNKDIEGTGIAFQGFKTAQTGGTDVALCDSGYNTIKTSGQWFNMNNNNRNSGGWNGCNMRNNTLPVVKAALPTELTSVIKTTTLYTDNTGGGSDVASYVTATQDQLYLLAGFEIFGARANANTAEQNYQKQYAYYVAGNSRIKYKHNDTATVVHWLERSVYATDARYFCLVVADGSGYGAGATAAYNSRGLAPAFKVGSNPPPQPISALAVGSSVYCKESGVDAEYLIVHQGIPNTTIYDSSCNGTWLLRKDILTQRQWGENDVNLYGRSYIHPWLNSTFVDTLGVKDVIKQVKIPYCQAAYYGSSASYGDNGLSAKAFLLSAKEIGCLNSESGHEIIPSEGTLLEYFSPAGNSANTKRIAYYNGAAVTWTTRSPLSDTASNLWGVNENGATSGYSVLDPDKSHSIRPAFIVPFDTQVDFQGNIVI